MLCSDTEVTHLLLYFLHYLHFYDFYYHEKMFYKCLKVVDVMAPGLLNSKVLH